MPPLTSADLQFYLSTTAGSAGYTNSGTPSTSLGPYLSITSVFSDDIPPNANNVFSDVTAAEHTAGQVDYRCLFVVNNHATDAVHAYVGLLQRDGEVNPSASAAKLLERYAFAVDNIAASAKGAGAAQASTVASTTTAPTAIGAWGCNVETQASLARGHYGGADLGLIPPGYCRAFWIRRTAVSAEPDANSYDGATLLLAVTL